MRIKNWKEFQHFKDRNPPWIKLHKNILEKRDINMISDRYFRVLIGLWLLASEDKNLEGNLPEIEDISFRLRIPENEIEESLQGLSDFLIFDDITVISERYQDDEPEKRRDREETEKIYECEFFSVEKKKHEKYQNAYPLVDIGEEYKKMLAWLESNPTKRKTKRGYPKFINSWLSRKSDKMAPPKDIQTLNPETGEFE